MSLGKGLMLVKLHKAALDMICVRNSYIFIIALLNVHSRMPLRKLPEMEMLSGCQL